MRGMKSQPEVNRKIFRWRGICCSCVISLERSGVWKKGELFSLARPICWWRESKRKRREVIPTFTKNDLSLCCNAIYKETCEKKRRPPNTGEQQLRIVRTITVICKNTKRNQDVILPHVGTSMLPLLNQPQGDDWCLLWWDIGSAIRFLLHPKPIHRSVSWCQENNEEHSFNFKVVVLFI